MWVAILEIVKRIHLANKPLYAAISSFDWFEIGVESDSSWQSKKVRAFSGVLGKVNLIEASWYKQESPFCIVLLSIVLAPEHCCSLFRTSLQGLI